MSRSKSASTASERAMSTNRLLSLFSYVLSSRPPSIHKAVEGHAAALHSNFTKQYAATSAEPKNNAAQNHASPLSSNLTQRVATTPLNRPTMLAPTSNAK